MYIGCRLLKETWASHISYVDSDSIISIGVSSYGQEARYTPAMDQVLDHIKSLFRDIICKGRLQVAQKTMGLTHITHAQTHVHMYIHVHVYLNRVGVGTSGGTVS